MMSAVCLDVCIGFSGDWVDEASALERPFSSFKDVGNSSEAWEHLARLSYSFQSGFLGQMEVCTHVSSDLGSPPKEEGMTLQKPDVNNSGLF